MRDGSDQTRLLQAKRVSPQGRPWRSSMVAISPWPSMRRTRLECTIAIRGGELRFTGRHPKRALRLVQHFGRKSQPLIGPLHGAMPAAVFTAGPAIRLLRKRTRTGRPSGVSHPADRAPEPSCSSEPRPGRGGIRSREPRTRSTWGSSSSQSVRVAELLHALDRYALNPGPKESGPTREGIRVRP